MNKIIKKILNYFCWLFTWCLNQGQKFMCFKESCSLYTIPKYSNKKQVKEEYKKYKKRLNLYGLQSTKRDFYVFRNYLVDNGKDPSYIIPAYINFNYLTPVLNPIEYGGFYEDKNMFDKILPLDFMPKTILRRINKIWYTQDYQVLPTEKIWEYLKNFEDSKEIIIKPSRNASSGKGVMLFKLNKGEWKEKIQGFTLDNETLEKNWGKRDLIIQEVLVQDGIFKYLCDTAVSTFRIVIYNSPLDGKYHLIWCGLKVGLRGAIVDNAHAGGLIFGVNENGYLYPYGTDQYGKKYTNFNGIDFSKEKIKIDNYEELIQFAKKSATFLLPNRFVSFDIAVNKDGDPKIIEYNLRAYSGWYCQFTGDYMYGNKTDEILNYITQNKKLGNKLFYSIS